MRNVGKKYKIFHFISVNVFKVLFLFSDLLNYNNHLYFQYIFDHSLLEDCKWSFNFLLKYKSVCLSQVLTTIVLQLLTAAFDVVGFGLLARHIPFRGESYFYRDTEVNKQRRPILLVLEPRHLPSHKWLNISNTVKKKQITQLLK